MNWTFGVIQGHPYWCKQKSTVGLVVVVMYNYVDLISKIYEDTATGKLQIRQFVRRVDWKSHFKMNWAFGIIQGHPYWCKQKSTVDPVVVVMYNYVDLISKITCKFANFNNLLRFDNSSLRNAFEYLQINYISRNWSQCPTFLPLIVWVCSSLFTAFTQFMGLSLSLFMLCATQTPFSLKVLARKQILTLSSQSRLI